MTKPVGVVGSLPKPRATLLIPDGGVIATRVHYETLNDAMFLLRVTLLSSILCLACVVLLSLATANVDIKLGIMAITSYPKLLFASSVWSSTSVFSAIQVVWFMAYCAFSHLIRLHFNTTDPPRDWDDRNGEWSVVELDVRIVPKPSMPQSTGPMQQTRSQTGTLSSRHDHMQPQARTVRFASSELADASETDDDSSMLPMFDSSCKSSNMDAVSSKSACDQWKLCVLPNAKSTTQTQTQAKTTSADITLLTPDTDYALWLSKQKQKR
ncbi:hypothetical protein LPJ57_006037 [Coemansia sp. RSA 486]|nr:hypothetical protein LPJ57_006037 [Coemansia sp. RSA 486]KAJ2233652.1 hypothetical protein IWW45_004020 [Coemansia sp. RSA 485]KAJ2601997.1 hypothetical protein GGF39_000944 [Coemansia sp. RSA 1721]